MDPVINYLRENRQRHIDALSEYIRIPSVSAQSHHKVDMAKAAKWLADRAGEAGLKAKIHATAGHPIVVAKSPRKAGRPHYVLYGHYDVQPAEPLELWKEGKAFEPWIEGDSIFGRGSSDNKGQHLAHLNAVEAFVKTGSELPCNLTFLIEGEEEVGSKSLPAFLKEHKKDLDCEGVVISDTGMPSLKLPALTYALRGILALELRVTGPDRDLHSGIFGGSVDNPAMVLAQMLAGVRDKSGKITIPGFYDGVRPLSKAERAQMARVSCGEAKYKKLLGVKALFGEKGFTADEQRSARPTFEINGLTSGYQGEGSKTIIPSWASAKITCRLVPNQDPSKLARALTSYFKKICPPTVRLEISSGHGGEPYLFDPESARAKAGLRALRAAFGCEPVLIREGGSIPIVNTIKKILGADSIMLGLALPDANAHSPNEKFSLTAYGKGMEMSAHLWRELGALAS